MSLPKTFPLTFAVVRQPELTEDGSYVGHITINGHDHHVTIFAVTNPQARREAAEAARDGINTDTNAATQEAIYDELDAAQGDVQRGIGTDDGRYDALSQFEDSDGPFETMEIDGQQFVCVVSPFCS